MGKWAEKWKCGPRDVVGVIAFLVVVAALCGGIVITIQGLSELRIWK